MYCGMPGQTSLHPQQQSAAAHRVAVPRQLHRRVDYEPLRPCSTIAQRCGPDQLLAMPVHSGSTPGRHRCTHLPGPSQGGRTPPSRGSPAISWCGPSYTGGVAGTQSRAGGPSSAFHEMATFFRLAFVCRAFNRATGHSIILIATPLSVSAAQGAFESPQSTGDRGFFGVMSLAGFLDNLPSR